MTMPEKDYASFVALPEDIDSQDVYEYEFDYCDDNLVALHKAIKKGNYNGVVEIIFSVREDKRKELINNTSLFESYFGTALHMAVRHHHGDNCRCLYITTGKNVNNYNDCNRHSLYRLEITNLLLSVGADPRITDYYGNDCLDYTYKKCIFSDPAPELYFCIAKSMLEKYLP